MNKFYVLFLFHLSLVLTACHTGNQSGKPELNSDRCIMHWFDQGHDDTLYGKKCLEGKKLFVQTDKNGRLAITTNAVSNKKDKGALRLEGDIKKLQKNKFYEVKYKILKDQGDYEHLPVRPFLPSSYSPDNLLKEHEKFFGKENHKYQIVFKPIGNYLILFKASKNKEDIPYTEWSSLVEENGLFMVPFLGYPIKYCNAENILSRQSGHETYKYRVKCGDLVDPKKAEYFRISKDDRQLYRYVKKKDLFPSSYFEGRWFLSQGSIETPFLEGHFSVSNAHLVELNKKSRSFQVKDVSGDVSERNQNVITGLPSIKWVQYEMALNGLNFEQFGERESRDNQDDPTSRPYLMLEFNDVIKEWGGQVTDVMVTEDYFSYLSEIPINFIIEASGRKQKLPPRIVKYKVSLFREDALDQKGFIPKRWFKDDNDHVFGVVRTSPQVVGKEGDYGEEDLYAASRVMRFNIRGKETTIKWHFSKNSTLDPFYRDIGREAVNVFNRAFEIITKGSGKKIKVVLADSTKDDQDLGDPRYNILNMVKTEELSSLSFTGNSNFVLLGMVPQYVHPNTGQVIGSTVNVFIQSIEKTYISYVREYIRYEIFRQKDRTAVNESEIHVVSPYIRKKIRSRCPEVEGFIDSKKKLNLNPRTKLKDKNLVLSCGKKISRARILWTTLHEMLHSFGADHNNKGSTDKNNYYESVEEIKQYFPMANVSKEFLPKASSVVDYPASEIPQLTVLGKYDINLLRYLYMDQVEKKGGGVLALNTPDKPEEQQRLSESILSQMKIYAHCADTIQSSKGHKIMGVPILDIDAEDFLCLRYDHGSNPEEIVQFEINKFRRLINYIRYRYDGTTLIDQVLSQDMYGMVYKIPYFYAKWIQVRDQYLTRNGLIEEARLILSSKEKIKNYNTDIEEGLRKSNKEYAQYYPIREMVADFFQDLIFTETMKCKVQDSQGKVRSLDLNAIKQILLPELKHQLYVRDCYSKHITDFLAKNNLSLIGQFGAEYFHSYYSEGINSDKNDVYPEAYVVKGLQDFSDRILRESTTLTMIGTRPEDILNLRPVMSLTQFAKEPDLFNEYIDRLKEKLFEAGPDKSNFELIQLVQSIKHLPTAMASNLTQSSKGDSDHILIQNLESFFSVTYNTGTGENSFFRRVIEPLLLGSSIEKTDIPFLIESYKHYMKTRKKTVTVQQHIKGFEKYLIGKGNVLELGISAFTIPFKSGSFMEKVIKTYNQNLELISAFDEKKQREGDLKAMETIDRQGLLAYNLSLKQIAQSIDFLQYSETQ